MKRRVILVTGSPRSATSTVGDVLGLSPGTVNLYEPMNVGSGDKSIDRDFLMPGTEGFSDEKFDQLLNRIAALDLNLKSGIWPGEPKIRSFFKYFIGGRSRISYMRARLKPNAHTVVWKDPIAAFTTPRVSTVHKLQTIVTYRSAHSVAASFKRMGWTFNLDDILSRAVQGGIALPGEFDGFDFDIPSVNGTVLWTLIYRNIARSAASPDVLRFVESDGLIQDPLKVYTTVFDWLELAPPKNLEALLENRARASGKKKAAVPSGHAHSKNRDLSKANSYWKQVLSDEEVDAIDRITESSQEQISSYVQQNGF